MRDLKELTRANVWALKPYSSARDEYSGADASVFLDANENPYNTPNNRYPDPLQRELKSLLAPLKGVKEENIFLGNGSDEAIDLIFRAFCQPGVDNVVAIEPTYGMYKVCAEVNDVEYRPMLLDDLVVMLFEEVEYVWPRLGYPPLVTPFSQYVKNVALMNVMQRVKGEDRWTMIDNNTWDMILGKSGKLPGALAPEIIELAKSKGLQFTDEDPQSNYPDALDTYRKEMDENGWEYGEDDEELFELAMHDRQYRDYKSGVAKERFLKDLDRAKDAEMAKGGLSAEEILQIKRAKADAILAPNNGQVLFELSVEGPSSSPSVGTKYNQDDFFCYISTPWGGFEKVHVGFTGRIVEISAKQGQMVRKGQPIAYIEREKE